MFEGVYKLPPGTFLRVPANGKLGKPQAYWTLPEQLSPEFYLLNRTLGIYDTLAMYVRRRVVPRRWVLDMWHHPLAGMQMSFPSVQAAPDGVRFGLEWHAEPGTKK